MHNQNSADASGRLVVIWAPHASRAERYLSHERLLLKDLTLRRGLTWREIAVENLPYFAARELIQPALRDGDRVVAAGGDGLVNVVLDAGIHSDKNISFAALPMGNINDFAHAMNGRATDPRKILNSEVIDFHPLELRVNRETAMYGAQYISLGATTALIGWLNSDEVRAWRAKHPGSAARLVGHGALAIGEVTRAVAQIAMPPFTRSGQRANWNSVGWFLGRVGGWFSPRLAGGRRAEFHLTDEFFAHTDQFPMSTAAVARKLTDWLARGLPGEPDDFDEIKFAAPQDLLIQIGGDNVELNGVQKISCERAATGIKVFCPRARQLEKAAATLKSL
jgi:hypothetical protein